MSDVEFNESGSEQNSSFYQSRPIVLGSPQTPGFVRLLMKMGISKDEKKAYNIMIGIMILCFLLTGLVIYMFLIDRRPTPTVPANIDMQVPAEVTPGQQ
jgi:hypothetical protein